MLAAGAGMGRCDNTVVVVDFGPCFSDIRNGLWALPKSPVCSRTGG